MKLFCQRDSISHDKREQQFRALLSIITPLIAIVLSMVVGGIVILLVGVSPFRAYQELLHGAFGTWSNIAETLVKTTPLLITGVGVSIAFRCNLTNVGAEGQMIVGAIASVAVALIIPDMPSALAVMTVLAVAFIGGGLYGALTGYLKAKFGTSEIISSIMLNYIAVSLLAFLLDGPMKEPNGYFPQTSVVPKATQLFRFVDRSRLHIGLVIGLIFVGLYYLLMFRLPLGYKIRAVGSNPHAASYAGINVRKSVVVALLLAGGLAGVAGMCEVFGLHLRLYNGISAGYGFDSLAIALLGRLHPLGIILASLFFGSLGVGAMAMQNAVQVPVSVINVIQGVSILFILSDNLIQEKIISWQKNHNFKKKEIAEMEVL